MEHLSRGSESSRNRLPAAVQALLDSELKPRERIAWMAQPIPSRIAKQGLPLVLFAIPWTIFSIYWIVGASGGGLGFAAFGVPFLLVGVGMLSAPYWLRRGAASTVYVITDQRALIIASNGRGTMTVRSFPPETLGDLHRTQDTNGCGDVIFRTNVSRDSDGDRTTEKVGFVGVQDVKGVEDRLRVLASCKGGA